MSGQFHHAAAAVLALVLCLAGVSFVALALVPAPGLYQVHTLPITPVSAGLRHIGRAAAYVLLLGYAAGAVGWVATFAARCDGMHRLASVLKDAR